MKYPNQAELLIIIGKTPFRAFDSMDWQTFAGCESDNPFIGYYEDFTIVLDGDMINIVHTEDEYGGQLYTLKQLA